MNPDLAKLQAYPFEKLRKLKAGIKPAKDSPILLSIGEPKHPTPEIIKQAIIDNLDGLAKYPLTKGDTALREAISHWLVERFSLSAANPETQVLPVNGTREALFAFAQAVLDRTQVNARVLLPNPFYQIYEGAALLAGVQPEFINISERSGLIPDFDSITESTWQQCQLLYICTPGNPTGAVIPLATLKHLIELAQRYDFIIASDECYSELYQDENQPPPGLLQAATEMGNTEFKQCVVFHSLSKRSNAPGLRSGFVAGDATILQKFLLYRTYHGCAMPPAMQAASTAAWSDESHVRQNRLWYQEKFIAVEEILAPVLKFSRPPAGFYLWPQTPMPDALFTRELYAQENVTVLPGSYLSRDTVQGNPGAGHVRIALVAPLEECLEAARRIVHFVEAQ
ncbi:succinyldiaminopimelate transaminase [Candidatus Venteria ishoeyi]|uniref:LL-diaminopimelate aminotransferase n=1 Tax=Candidatus Venteria ishoeyi TaxID=1899563 RepID=A0A1H6F7E6_9GAMM|nr:succinyldiaminopimelate transaminase [Candidatus Venteria ishoeyi]SEH06060.1 LL-diaminopimelate aminotransferase [Candidatus Venteria ishoeyi]